MSLGDIVGNNLKKLRKEKGLTQIAMQMQTGIEQALISKYENGERIPPTETLILLADFFDTNIDYLLDRTDNPNKVK
ncbi:helix-turn-helix domain-containing protein [uncultured Eubacterium sp.]|uniref:helix-turn-helix domain-containing protein n=1 Tax=uncultured Eubacterium sp. TaxID=165185 RepID=UPI0025CCFC28|nr:helix-turn-helix transcriptional regulator [uncultured Eubacterium sp.]